MLKEFAHDLWNCDTEGAPRVAQFERHWQGGEQIVIADTPEVIAHKPTRDVILARGKQIQRKEKKIAELLIRRPQNIVPRWDH